MAWNSNLKKGTDLPTWDWLSFYPNAASYPGSCLAYDGIRYAYGAMQTGNTSNAAVGTTTLWRYDTWADAWQQLSSMLSATAGADCVYDPVRNVFWTTQGVSLTSWAGYNLSPTYPTYAFQAVVTGAGGSPTLTILGGANATGIAVGMYVAGTGTSGALGTSAVTVGHTITAISGNTITLSGNMGGTGTATGMISGGASYTTYTSVAGTAGAYTLTLSSGSWSNNLLTGSIISNASIPAGTVVLSGQGSSTLTISQPVTTTLTGATTTVAFFQPVTLANGSTAVAGLSLSPYSNLSMTSPLLPSGATNVGASIALVEDVTVGETMATGTVHSAGSFSGTGATLLTSFTESISTTDINVGHVGCSIRFTGTSAPTGRGIIKSVSYSRGNAINAVVVGSAGTNTLTLVGGNTAASLGLSVGMTVKSTCVEADSVITVISGSTVTISGLTTAAISPTISCSATFISDGLTVTIAGGSLSAAPALGNTYFVEYPQETATSGSTTTLVDTTQNWIANTYRDSDVVITSGAGAGQRRRIASNTATTLNVASTQTGLVATLATGTATVTLTTGSTTNMCIGQVLTVTGGSGAFGASAVVQSISSATVFTASINHATAGSTTFSATYNVGNTRVGAWTTAPDSTSVYKIVPSSDFMYYIPGNATSMYRIDLNTNNNAVAWSSVLPNNISTIGNFTAGSTLMYGEKCAPFSLYATRGNTLYRYDIGAQGWSTVNQSAGFVNASSVGTSDSFATTGSTAAMLPDHNRVAVHVSGSTRLYAIRLADGFVEPLGTLPYSAPTAYDGRRMFYAKSADGIPWLYFQRAGGGEFYRLALEWY